MSVEQNALNAELEALKAENAKLKEQNKYFSVLFENSPELKAQYDNYLELKSGLDTSDSELNNSAILVFDYLIKDDRVLVIKENNDFSFKLDKNKTYTLEQFIDGAGVIQKEDQDNVRKTFSFLLHNGNPVNVVIKVFDKDKKPIMATLELHCFYDLKRNPIRVSCMLTKVPDDKVNDTLIQMDVEMSQNRLSEFMGNAMDIVLYVNPDLNYYHVFQA